MSDSQATKGQVADAVKGNWVDRRAPRGLRPYLRLSRADRPIGTWLLLLPCWWGVLLASLSTGAFGWRGLWIAVGCGIGAVLMRGAGCTWNDITDRHIDSGVARTRSRPIPSGQVDVARAMGWLVAQALVAMGILLTFNANAILMGILSLATVAVYPFAKRFTWWPQIFLGLAFNWGALLAWTAQAGSLGWPAVILYLSGICWTLFYDTIYAYQDAEDDALIGVKSTARLFADRPLPWLRGFTAGAAGLMALAILLAAAPAASSALLVALCAPVAMAAHMVWQLSRFDPALTETCLRLFRSNRDAGLLAALFLALSVAL